MTRSRVGLTVFAGCTAVAFVLWFVPGVPTAEWSTAAACLNHTPSFSPQSVWVVGVDGVPVPALVYDDGCNTVAYAHPAFLAATFALCGLVAEGIETAYERHRGAPRPSLDGPEAGEEEWR
ncbi:hypothetical protein [Halomarina rubra]|uniref:Uncharacterized protein n=1 Tax=Halomarina rubra TaxID=2071873 RepID=A0ABD6AZN8_9EURY|nr:hypothetical protein [Halomarina rubra]